MQIFVVAEMLGKFAHEVIEEMSYDELVHWAAYINITNKLQENAMKRK